MDDNTRWQDATLSADSQVIGPVLPSPDDGYDELTSGIASIFAAMQTSGPDEGSEGHTAEGEAADEEHIFTLLGELDRLWQRPSP